MKWQSLLVFCLLPLVGNATQKGASWLNLEHVVDSGNVDVRSPTAPLPTPPSQHHGDKLVRLLPQHSIPCSWRLQNILFCYAEASQAENEVGSCVQPVELNLDDGCLVGCYQLRHWRSVGLLVVVVGHDWEVTALGCW